VLGELIPSLPDRNAAAELPPPTARTLIPIRTIMAATHTKDELQKALELLKRVGKMMGVVS
jgi:hypothetical protein